MIDGDLGRMLLVVVSLAIAAPRGAVALGDSTTGAGCAVTTGGSGTANNNTVNCGYTAEQVALLIKVATEPLQGVISTKDDKIAELAKQIGANDEATRSLLRIVGAQNAPQERLAETLSRVATDYKRLQAQAEALNSDNPIARALIDKANTEIDAGHFSQARQFLQQARQAQVAAGQAALKLRDQAQAAVDANFLGAAASAATEGGVALTEGHYAQAADLFGEAAGYVPSGQPGARLGYLERQADALYRQGDERGDNDALRGAIAMEHRMLEERTRNRVPLDWARTQMNLGNALQTLGSRESGTARLEEAVAAYRLALEEMTRDRVPLDWAGTQMNLGAALRTLGSRESGTARLEEAVAAYRLALEERTRDRVPLDWARTQMNLGDRKSVV